MLRLIVLGLIPGTNIQISFSALLAVLLLVCATILAVKSVGNWKFEKFLVSSYMTLIVLASRPRA